MWKCKEWWYIQLTLGIWCGPLSQHPLPPARQVVCKEESESEPELEQEEDEEFENKLEKQPETKKKGKTKRHSSKQQ